MAQRKPLVQVAGALKQLPSADSLVVPVLVLPQQASAPGTAAAEGAVYSKDVSGTSQLFYQPSSSGTPVQVTPPASGGATEALAQSWVDFFQATNGNNGSTGAGSFTTGATYVFKRRVKINGIRFVWAGGAATIRATLYRFTSGAVLATVDLAVGGAGIYIATFGAAYTIAAAEVGQYLTCAIWQTAGTAYSRYTSGMAEAGVAAPYPVARSCLVKENPIRFVAGNASPGGVAVTEWYAVEPDIDPTLV